jgi:hypothetical protein
MPYARTASYMLALIMLVFGVVGLLYAGKPLKDGRSEEGIPLAAAAAAALVIGYFELRMFIINELIEEEETLLEDEMSHLTHIEDVESHIEDLLKKPDVREHPGRSPKAKGGA